ncbi:MAG: hypothetical protein ACREMA_04900 [Longimicrobiales bacterium]
MQIPDGARPEPKRDTKLALPIITLMLVRIPQASSPGQLVVQVRNTGAASNSFQSGQRPFEVPGRSGNNAQRFSRCWQQNCKEQLLPPIVKDIERSMAKLRGVMAIGAAAAAIVFGKSVVKAIAVGAGFLVANSGAGFLATPQIEKELRAGFKEVSPEWATWKKQWQDSTAPAFRRWGARIAAEYLTEAELLDVYAKRADMFESLANDPALNPVCGMNAVIPTEVDYSKLNMKGLHLVMGRGFARRHTGAEAWTAPVRLEEDHNAWAAFAEFLLSRNAQDVLDVFLSISDGRTVPNQAGCLAQAKLYRLAATSPDAKVGNVRLFDFVRAIDALGARTM